MLTDELTVTKEKAAGYDELKRIADATCAQVASLQESAKKAQEEADRALAEAIQRVFAALQKDHKVELDSLKKAHAVEEDKLRSQMDRAVSDAKKDADLALAKKDQEKAAADKEREMMAQLRESNRENARLQAQIGWLQKQIEGLEAQVSAYQSGEKIE